MRPGHLTCPYNECKKEFEKPLVLTDFSSTPRETYYACPHCLTKVEVVTEDSKLDSVSVETSGKPVEKTPTECTHHLGYLENLPKEATIPDECLTCPKLLQCFVKKENIAIEVR
jgi:DNA-directed RNA polymerase subunit RPC12/RpoP